MLSFPVSFHKGTFTEGISLALSGLFIIFPLKKNTYGNWWKQFLFSSLESEQESQMQKWTVSELWETWCGCWEIRKKILWLFVGRKCCAQVSIFHVIWNYLTIDNFKYVYFEHIVCVFWTYCLCIWLPGLQDILTWVTSFHWRSI